MLGRRGTVGRRLAVDVSCEPLGRARVLCQVTVSGATAPVSIHWYYNGFYFSSMDNKTFTGWGCNPTGGNTYTAVVTDGTGSVGQDSSGVFCVSGNP